MSAAGTNSAAPWRRRAGARRRAMRRARSLRRLPRFALPARHVEKHLLEAVAAVAREQCGGRIVVDDRATPHDDDALAQALDLEHVVRGEQDGGAAALAVALEPGAYPVGGVGIERGGRL